MRRRLLLSRSPGEARVALVADGRLIDYEVHRDHSPSRLGGIFLGRIRKGIGDGRQGFVDIGDAEVLADLDADSAAAAGWSLSEGAAVPVQITQEARRGRLARGTTRLAFAGPRLVYLPFGAADGVSHRITDPKARRAVADRIKRLDRNGGAVIARERTAGASAEALNQEIGALGAEWTSAAERLRSQKSVGPLVPPPAPGLAALRDAVDPQYDAIECDDRDLAASLDRYCRTFFPDAPPAAVISVADMDNACDDLDEQIEAALSRRVALDGGGSIAIERTEGLTAIDIDAGTAFDTAAKPRGVEDLNRRAAVEIARQLRVRALGGLVAVDLAGAPRGATGTAITEAFLDAFRDDPMRTEIEHVERPGVILVSRQWSRRPLAEIVAEAPLVDDGPLPESLDTVVLRAARSARRAAAIRPMARLVVHLSEAVASHWDAPHLAPAIAALGAALGFAPSVAAHADWPAQRVEIEAG